MQNRPFGTDFVGDDRRGRQQSRIADKASAFKQRLQAPDRRECSCVATLRSVDINWWNS
jgi:hypothetical protein